MLTKCYRKTKRLPFFSRALRAALDKYSAVPRPFAKENVKLFRYCQKVLSEGALPLLPRKGRSPFEPPKRKQSSRERSGLPRTARLHAASLCASDRERASYQLMRLFSLVALADIGQKFA